MPLLSYSFLPLGPDYIIIIEWNAFKDYSTSYTWVTIKEFSFWAIAMSLRQGHKFMGKLNFKTRKGKAGNGIREGFFHFVSTSYFDSRWASYRLVRHEIWPLFSPSTTWFAMLKKEIRHEKELQRESNFSLEIDVEKMKKNVCALTHYPTQFPRRVGESLVFVVERSHRRRQCSWH